MKYIIILLLGILLLVFIIKRVIHWVIFKIKSDSDSPDLATHLSQKDAADIMDLLIAIDELKQI